MIQRDLLLRLIHGILAVDGTQQVQHGVITLRHLIHIQAPLAQQWVQLATLQRAIQLIHGLEKHIKHAHHQ